jgi:hypothetical protein
LPAPKSGQRINSRIRLAVWDAYLAARVVPGAEFDAWVEENAPKFKLDENQVRGIITGQSEATLFAIKQASCTAAQ